MMNVYFIFVEFLRLMYDSLACAEGRATLESDLSADTGG